MAKDQNCERFIEEAEKADGFFGAECHTWVGGFSAGCKEADLSSKVNRSNCYAEKAQRLRNDENTKQIVDVLKWAAIAIIAFFFLKWYLT